MSKPDKLHEELLEEGATHEEAATLAGLATHLKQLSAPCPTLPLHYHGWSLTRVTILSTASAFAFFMIGGGLVSAAQTSQPGSSLYPVKRASENVMMDMSPSFASRIMMRRVSEIDTLAETHGSQDMILSEVHDYDMTMRRAPLDTATRDYCAEHLEHAAKLTSGSEQLAIENALQRMGYAD